MADRHRSMDRTRDSEEFVDDETATPGHSGRKQGNLERDVGTRDEKKRAEKGEAGATRVTKSDEEGEGNLGGHHGTGKGGS